MTYSLFVMFEYQEKTYMKFHVTFDSLDKLIEHGEKLISAGTSIENLNIMESGKWYSKEDGAFKKWRAPSVDT